MATKTQPVPETDTSVPHPRYESTSRACYDRQDDVARAWAEGKYPPHNEGRLYSSENFRGQHHPDGAGTLWHYRTREAIRTKSGLIINNSECWSRGFAHCSPAPEADYRLPLSAIEAQTERGVVLHRRRKGANAYRITDVKSEDDPRSGAYGRWYIAEIEGHSGGIGVGTDRTARNGGRFTVDLPPFVVEYAEAEGVRKAIIEYLRPDAVSAATRGTEAFPDGLPVVTSDEYRKYDLTEEEAEAHREAGGKTSVREYWYRPDRTVNHQMHRADLQGSVIVRQGEYFFVPRPETDPTELPGAEKTRWALGSHKHNRAAVQTESPSGERLFVRGRVGHTRRDHHMIDLGDTWHEVFESPVDVHQVDTGTD
jgi:hypothetical protein